MNIYHGMRRFALGSFLAIVGSWGLMPSAGAVEGITLLRLGWIYEIGFPEIAQASLEPGTGLVRGVQAYRVTAFGGQQWYRLQLVSRQPGGNGWYNPQGVPDVWVNLNYALWVHEVVR